MHNLVLKTQNFCHNSTRLIVIIKNNRELLMKNLLALFALMSIIMSLGAFANTNYDNAMVIGPETGTEKINLKMLDQSDDSSSEIVDSKVLNFKAESIRDTQRKSFHSLRNVDELSNDDMIIIK